MKRILFVGVIAALLFGCGKNQAPPAHPGKPQTKHSGASGTLISKVIAPDGTYHLRPRSFYVDMMLAAQQFAKRHLPFAPDIPMADTSRKPVPESAWQRNTKARFRVLLEHRRADVLVVPVQVQYFALDRIERAMMTLRLANAIQDATGYKVADPFLVSRALGERQRRINASDVYALANAMKVKTIVWSYAGQNLHYTMRLSVGVQRRTAGKPLGASTSIKFKKVESPFTDESLPSEIFPRLLTRLLPPDLLPKQHAVAHTYPRLESVPMPRSPDALISNPPASPLRSAYALEMLAELYPAEPSIGAERVLERAMLALDSVGTGSPDYPFLKAFALYKLNRRPAALKLLAASNGPEVDTLRALLNGNLPQAQSAQKKIERRLPAVLLELEVIRLAVNYQTMTFHAVKNELVNLAEKFPGWALFLNEYYAGFDTWTTPSNYPLKKAMDKSFPVDGYTADTLLQGKLILADPSDINGVFDFSVDEHVSRLLSGRANDWCCAPLTTKPGRWDLLGIYEAFGEFNLLQRVKFQHYVQGNTHRAVQLLDRYGAVYGGEPYFEAERIFSQESLAQKMQGQERVNLGRRISEELYNDWNWMGGQTDQAYRLVNVRHGITAPALSQQIELAARSFNYDFPPRGYWVWATPNGAVRKREGERSRTSYVCSNFNMVSFSTGAAGMLDQIKSRFDGNPDKAIFLADHDTDAGNTDKAVADLMKIVNAKSNDWAIYRRAGRLLMQSGKFNDAAKVMHEYPGFSDVLATGPEKVAYSNYAMEAGSLLFWRGLASKSKPFFELAAGYDTGSGASIESAARLALLDGRYQDAAAYSMRRARRYGAVWGYRDYLELLHVFGMQQESWQAFDAIVDRFNALPLWQAALVGNHKAGTSAGKLRKWVMQNHIRKAGDADHELAADFWIMANVVDRTPDEGFPRLLEKLEKHGWRIIRDKDGNAFIIMDVVKGSRADNGLPTPEDFASVRKNPRGQYIKTPRVYFAEAYVLLRNGKYKEAHAEFNEELKNDFDGFYLQRNTRSKLNHWQLPYMAWAAAMAGDTAAVEAGLKKTALPDRDFYWYLAAAFVSAVKSNDNGALDDLNAALNRRHYTMNQPVLTEYQFAEACEALYEWRKAKPYRDLALDWAKKYEVIQPMFAWPYALEAKLEMDPTNWTAR